MRWERAESRRAAEVVGVMVGGVGVREVDGGARSAMVARLRARRRDGNKGGQSRMSEAVVTVVEQAGCR